MAYTRTWQSLVDVASDLYKGIPITAVTPNICNVVSSEAWNAYPWRERIQNIAVPGTLLVDGQQDYDVPTNIHLLLRARITRTDVTPDQSTPLDVVEHLEPDLNVMSWTAMRLISHEPDLGKFRLEQAVQVTSPTVLRLNGEYEIQHTKITATSQGLWFKDQFEMVGIKGIAYWGYKIADDSRAGTAVTDGSGRVSYSGMLGEFKAAIEEMRQAEDFGAMPVLSPDDALGSSQYSGSSWLFP